MGLGKLLVVTKDYRYVYMYVYLPVYMSVTCSLKAQ